MLGVDSTSDTAMTTASRASDSVLPSKHSAAEGAARPCPPDRSRDRSLRVAHRVEVGCVPSRRHRDLPPDLGVDEDRRRRRIRSAVGVTGVVARSRVPLIATATATITTTSAPDTTARRARRARPAGRASRSDRAGVARAAESINGAKAASRSIISPHPRFRRRLQDLLVHRDRARVRASNARRRASTRRRRG